MLSGKVPMLKIQWKITAILGGESFPTQFSVVFMLG